MGQAFGGGQAAIDVAVAGLPLLMVIGSALYLRGQHRRYGRLFGWPGRLTLAALLVGPGPARPRGVPPGRNPGPRPLPSRSPGHHRPGYDPGVDGDRDQGDRCVRPLPLFLRHRLARAHGHRRGRSPFRVAPRPLGAGAVAVGPAPLLARSGARPWPPRPRPTRPRSPAGPGAVVVRIGPHRRAVVRLRGGRTRNRERGAHRHAPRPGGGVRALAIPAASRPVHSGGAPPSGSR